MSWAEGLTYCSSNLSHGIVTWTWRKYWRILSGQPIRDQYCQQLTNERPAISQSGRLSLASASETPPPGPNSGQCQYFNGSEDKEKLTDVL